MEPDMETSVRDSVESGCSRMCIEVEGDDITPEEFYADSGWRTMGPGTKAPAGHVSHQSRSATKKYARNARASATKAARMPDVLPKEDIKIVVRPRGGLNIAKTGMTAVASAIMVAAKVPRAEGAADSFCPNLHQNIVVVSTPDDKRARMYNHIKSICIDGKEYEVGVYRTAPHGTVKGVIRGIPVEDTRQEIEHNVINSRNPLALGAQRIGNSITVIVAFQGQKVPNYVCYGPVITKCNLYRKHFDVCRLCGKVGHRRDVCPTPNANVCFACGTTNPKEGHDCTPKCRLCGGPHETGDKTCKNKYKTPYVVRRRQWERKMAEEQLQLRAQLGSGDFPSLTSSLTSSGEAAAAGRGASRTQSKRRNSERRQRSASRRRSQSRDKVSWANIAKNKSKKIEGNENKEEDEATRAMREANEALRRENAELKATVNKMSKEIEDIKKMLATRTTAGTETPEMAPCGAGVGTGGGTPATPETKGPAAKKRAIESPRDSTVTERINSIEDRLNKIEARFDSFEARIDANFTKLEEFIKTAISTMETENVKRLTFIEQTLRPMVTHPTFASVMVQHPYKQETTQQFTLMQSWPPQQQ